MNNTLQRRTKDLEKERAATKRHCLFLLDRLTEIHGQDDEIIAELRTGIKNAVHVNEFRTSIFPPTEDELRNAEAKRHLRSLPDKLHQKYDVSDTLAELTTQLYKL